MTEPPNRAKSIFLDAVENCPPVRWDEFLDGACGADAGLRRRVRALLDAHREADSLLDHPGPSVPEAAGPVEVGPGRDTRLGDFRLLRQVGRGGMGVVYEAEQVSLRRRVALKVLPLAAVLDEQSLRRFRREAKAAGQLHHTNIVPVYAVGCERGVHYYAMQFIDGQPLSGVVVGLRRLAESGQCGDPSQLEAPARDLVSGRFAAEVPTAAATAAHSRATAPAPTLPYPDPDPDPPLSGPGGDPSGPGLSGDRAPRRSTYVRSVARLGVQAAEALEHAHAHGVIHRDIKPANLLLDGRGNLWVTDFGLARLQDDHGLTLTGDVLGTLRYMSPEQAAGSKDLDHRTDVYSLGATLYELLALRPAVAGAGQSEILRAIAHDEPPPLRRLNPAVPRDLETIVAKALAREPARRYATAGAMTADLRAFLEHRPISARRPGRVERAVKWVRRHRVVSAAALCVAAASLLAMAFALEAHQRRLDALAAQLAAHRADGARLEARVDALVEEAQRRGAGRRPDFARAVALLTEALGYRPGDADLFLYRGTARHELGRHAEAIADCEHSLELRPARNPAAHWMIVLAALQLGQADKAQRHREQADREDPDDVRSLVAQALALAHDERGLTLMDRAIEREPFDPTLYFYRGRIATNLAFRRGERRDYERAVDDLEKALLARPGDPKVLAPLCDVLLNATELGDISGWSRARERAGRLLDGWRRLHPDDTDALRLAMEYDHGHGDYRRCIELARDGQRLAPNDPVFPLHMAWAYDELNDHHAAERSYDRAAELQPSLLVLATRAVCRGYHRGDRDKTSRELAELRRRYPPESWTYADWLALCNMYSLVADHRGALSVCDDYLRMVPGASNVHVRRAIALGALGEQTEARAALTRALELDPTNWHPYQVRGWSYEGAGQHDKALADVTRYIESPSVRPRDGRFSPDQLTRLAEAVGGRGAILHTVGRRAEAERDERECLALRLKIEGEGLTGQFTDLSDWDLGKHYDMLAALLPKYYRPDETAAALRTIRPDPPRQAGAGAVGKQGRVFVVLAQQLADTDAKGDQERAWRQAAALFQRASEDARQASPRWQRERARCHAALAALLRAAGRDEESDAQDRAAADADRRWRAWVESLADPPRDASHDTIGERGALFVELAQLLATTDAKSDQERAWRQAAALLQRASEAGGAFPRWERLRARCHAELAAQLRAAGRAPEADEHERRASQAAARWREGVDRRIEQEPDDPRQLNEVARWLATYPVPAIRDAARAVELAKKAVKLEPNREGYWDTLGVALYRSGDWDGAAEALRRSRELMGRDDPGTVLVLAMAQWRRGRPDEARALFDEAATRLRRPGATVTDEQSLFLGEASALLGESPVPRQGPGARSSTEPKAPPG